MTIRERIVGLGFIASGCAIALISIVHLLSTGPLKGIQDFRVVYFPARALLQGQSPYDPQAVLRVLKQSGQASPSATVVGEQYVTRYLYPPTAFAVTYLSHCFLGSLHA